MKIIAGLGNPGIKYENTRHNIGFMFCDYLQNLYTWNKQFSVSTWSYQDKFEAFISQIKKIDYSNKDIIIVKPNTFMNRSGDSLYKLKKFYKEKVEKIILVFDDLDITIGKWKIQENTIPKCHNGVNSVVSSIGNNFLSIRIGIENRKESNPLNSTDYLIDKMSSVEKDLILVSFREVCENLFVQDII